MKSDKPLIERKLSVFLYLLRRDSEERDDLRTYKMAFRQAEWYMIYNLLQAARFAFRMQQAERHNSIED